MRALVGCLTALVVVPVLAGCAVVTSTGVQSRSQVRLGRHLGRAPAGTTAGNKRRAQVDAAALLARVRVPNGAIWSSREPRGDDGLLKPSEVLTTDQAHVVVYRWWTSSGTPSSVLAYLKANPPAGATMSGTGSGSDPRHDASSQSLDYSWPVVARVLGDRELDVTVVPLARGGTGVLAEAQSDWIVMRTAGEKIPGAVREVDVTSARPRGPRTVSMQITSPGKVHELMSLIDAMPIVQPIMINCPALIVTGARVVTLSFRAARGGPVLAQATYTAYGSDLTAPSDECTPIEFSIRGHRQTALIGGDFINHANRLLGINLMRS